MKKLIFLLMIMMMASFISFSQIAPTGYGKGLKVELNEDGSKYFRLITWHQFWLTTNAFNSDNEFSSVTPMLRRSRFLMFSQISDRFLILTHFGLNSLTTANMHPVGKSADAQLFMHDAWLDFKVNKYLHLGAGLHYWNGISRLSNQSTLNFLTLDNPRHAWATIGTTDQFARHLGVFAKGKVGKLDYRFAWNGATVNSLDAINALPATTDKASYIGRQTFGVEAKNVYAGYVNYQFLDQESNTLPYFVGTYFGSKKIFNIGAGFYSHPKGSVLLDVDSSNIEENALIFAVDAFAELPIGDNLAFTGYLSYQSNNYGTNYQLSGTSQAVFSGDVIYFHGGILLPSKGAVSWQPYVSITQKSVDALDESATDFGLGINSLITGHHAKLTLEYKNVDVIGADRTNQFLLQTVIFL